LGFSRSILKERTDPTVLAAAGAPGRVSDAKEPSSLATYWHRKRPSVA